MSVLRYTTPTVTLTFTEENLDFTQCNEIIVSFESKGTKIEKGTSQMTVNEKSLVIELTQEETGMFALGRVDIQANWTTPSGKRGGSNIRSIDITKNLHNEVM